MPAKPVTDVSEPFIHEGFASFSSVMSDSTTIKILRDTGATQSLLLSNTFLFSEESSVGTNVLTRVINCLNAVQCRFILSKSEYSRCCHLRECILFYEMISWETKLLLMLLSQRRPV